MIKAGGIIGIIAGVLGVIAAFATLMFGGIASMFEGVGGSSAATVVWLGWGGVFFSFTVIVFSSISFAKPKVSGIALILSSIGGIVLGGTIVAIFMTLSLVGGILVTIGSRKTTHGDVDILATPRDGQTAGSGWKKPVAIAGIAGGVIVVIILILGISSGKYSGRGRSGETGGPISEIVQLESAQVFQVEPYGELAAMFNLGSSHTNIQRENAIKGLKGKVVVWQLPVYEVSKRGDAYQVQTKTGSAVGTFTYIKARNDQERSYLESIKTGDIITFKGIIAGVDLTRCLIVKPAIIYDSKARQTAGQAPGGSGQAGMTGKYVLKDGEISGELDVKQMPNNNIAFSLGVSLRGCGGVIEESIVQVTNNTAVFKGENDCKLTMRFNQGKISVEEDGCAYYHGAACGFDGEYVRK